jgi:serine/threonine protein kinase
LRALWQTTLPAVPRTHTLRTRKRVLEDVASLFYRLHSLGIFHHDLKGTNILLRDNPCENQRLFLVDVGDVRAPRRLLWQKRVRNLLQLCEIPGRFWTTREKAFFLKHYSDLCGLSKYDRHALVHDVLQTTGVAKSPLRLRPRGPISFNRQV